MEQFDFAESALNPYLNINKMLSSFAASLAASIDTSQLVTRNISQSLSKMVATIYENNLNVAESLQRAMEGALATFSDAMFPTAEYQQMLSNIQDVLGSLSKEVLSASTWIPTEEAIASYKAAFDIAEEIIETKDDCATIAPYESIRTDVASKPKLSLMDCVALISTLLSLLSFLITLLPNKQLNKIIEQNEIIIEQNEEVLALARKDLEQPNATEQAIYAVAHSIDSLIEEFNDSCGLADNPDEANALDSQTEDNNGLNE